MTVQILMPALSPTMTEGTLAKWLKAEGARSVEIAVLTHKEKTLPQPCQPDYPALKTPDRYVYGFGLDVDGLWRNANGIFVANPS